MSDTLKQSVCESSENYGFGVEEMQKFKVCPECGAVSKASEQLCTECGAKLPRQNLFQAYKKQSRCCTVCDTVVSTSAQFCPICGTKLRKK